MGAKDSKFIHVAFPDGKVKLYEHPFPVSDLLKKFPQHYMTTLPIHQMYTWTACLPSEQILQPGNLYFIRPIPTDYNSSIYERKARRKQESQPNQTNALDRSNSYKKRVGKRKECTNNRKNAIQCYKMLSCVHPQASPIHLAIAARIKDRTFGKLNTSFNDCDKNDKTCFSGRDVLQINLSEDTVGHEILEDCDDADRTPEDNSEIDLEFLHQQLQLYGVSRPTGLDMRLSFKWKPALPSIVEFADLPPKFQQKLGA